MFLGVGRGMGRGEKELWPGKCCAQNNRSGRMHMPNEYSLYEVLNS